ncbi:MAG TPA: hypothetical protein VNH21_14255 [Steroidobacteraceae bacterium]|nr:hypothetical protein [Steroidobacteraceae bacterium]
MSDLLRLLYRPDEVHRAPGNAMPRDPADRAEIHDFLSARMIKPLHWSDGEYHAHVKDTLETMTWAERIWTEIEMTQAVPSYYTSDYDPLRV